MFYLIKVHIFKKGERKKNEFDRAYAYAYASVLDGDGFMVF